MPTLNVLAWPGCTFTEVAPAIGMIAPGWPLRVLGPSLDPIRTSEGLQLLPDAPWSTLTGSRLLLIPGGEPSAILEDPALHAALRRAAESGLVAGICNGALLMARAGLLDGRRCTHTATPRYAPRPDFDALLEAADHLFAHATYVDEDVVIDGDLITAKPWAALRFGAAVARLSGALTREEAAAAARYGSGRRDMPGEDPHTLYGIHLEQTGGPTPFPAIQAHVRHLHQLEREGRLVLAGPWADGQGGLVVVRATGLSEAEGIAAADPFVTLGHRRATVRAWPQSNEDNDHMGALP